MVRSTTITEADILERVVSPEVDDMSPAAARTLLKWKFDAEARKRIRQLLRKNNQGTITDDERIVLEKYLRVGQFLDLVHAKAKLAIRKNGSSH